MIKYKRYGYWYSNWDTYDTKKASKNRRYQWLSKNFAPNNINQFILHNKN